MLRCKCTAGNYADIADLENRSIRIRMIRPPIRRVEHDNEREKRGSRYVLPGQSLLIERNVAGTRFDGGATAPWGGRMDR